MKVRNKCSVLERVKKYDKMLNVVRYNVVAEFVYGVSGLWPKLWITLRCVLWGLFLLCHSLQNIREKGWEMLMFTNALNGFHLNFYIVPFSNWICWMLLNYAFRNSGFIFIFTVGAARVWFWGSCYAFYSKSVINTWQEKTTTKKRGSNAATSA